MQYTQYIISEYFCLILDSTYHDILNFHFAHVFSLHAMIIIYIYIDNISTMAKKLQISHRIDESSLASLKWVKDLREKYGLKHYLNFAPWVGEKNGTGIYLLYGFKEKHQKPFEEDVLTWTVPFFHWELWVISFSQHRVSLCKGLCTVDNFWNITFR